MKTNKFISTAEYYSQVLMEKKNTFNAHLHGAMLLHQFCNDQYAKTEQWRLNFLKSDSGQKKIKAALYSGLSDAIAHDEFQTVGHRIILPSSFPNSPRWFHRKYQNAMAIVQHTSRPDLFTTMTTNSNWPEITRELYPGQASYQRPDLLARVFNLKLRVLFS